MKLLFAAAVGVALLVAPETQAQTNLGWVSTLAGSCWQGVGANGAQVDRQCFQTQFNRVLRMSVTRADGFSGASVLGYSTARHRLEMYAWSNQNDPAIYTPQYDQAGALAFAEADGRVVWRNLGHDSFEIARQTRNGNTWADASVITYHRDGTAQSAFEATGGNSIAGASGGFNWLDAQAGHCFHEVEPGEVGANHGCLSWEYPQVLHLTWYWGGANATGESVMFHIGSDVRSFYWDASGNFGVASGAWNGEALYSTNDASPNRRTALRPARSGFTTTTEIRRGDGRSADWELDHSIRLRNN